MDFAQYPVGARAKSLLLSPSTFIPDIKPSWRYLFKKSVKYYPDQFWGEIIAYRIGSQIGVEVPKAFPAVRSTESGKVECAALIEWFHDKDNERFVHAGDYFVKLDENFDRERGTRHNLNGFIILARMHKTNWKDWLLDMALFDALIGNTDRHQDNWGFIFSPTETEEGRNHCRLSPLFDNGTSLGHERFPDRVSSWSHQQLSVYIHRGTHHMRRSHPEHGFTNLKHIDFLRELVEANPTAKDYLATKITLINGDFLDFMLSELTEIECPVPLTEMRANWIKRLTIQRIEYIKGIVT
ncbi:HipA domain-containing protein [Yersinia ruckeri]|uniref:HipA domain-containing protein n=1 Tax=Yersinia ruckeri TaxID=29486 RepID=UPI000AF1C3C0|nr:HipA domain-containing protein [Yersinia ruckeri]